MEICFSLCDKRSESAEKKQADERGKTEKKTAPALAGDCLLKCFYNHREAVAILKKPRRSISFTEKIPLSPVGGL